MLNKFRKKLTQIILILFFIYFSILVFLYFNQRNLLYHPNENNYSGDKISVEIKKVKILTCLLYTSPSPRDRTRSRMPSSA